MESLLKKLTVLPVCALLVVAAISLTGQAQASLVAEYSFDETSGTVAHDSLGSRNGNLLGDAAFAPGQGINGSGAVSLARETGDLVDMGDNFGFSSFSIQTWVKIPNGYGSVEVPFGKHVAGYGIGPYVSISEGSAGTAHFFQGATRLRPIRSQPSTTDSGTRSWPSLTARHR